MENLAIHSSFPSIFELLLSIICGLTGSEAHCIITSEDFRRFGPDCTFKCHCVYSTEECNTETGACASGCDYEWTGPGCQYKNIALEEESRQLDNTFPEHFSDLANDRYVGTCSFTGNSTTNRTQVPWWAVWFPRNVTFREIVFVTLKSHLHYFAGFKVTIQQGVSQTDNRKKVYHVGQLCYQHDSSTPKDRNVHVKCNSYLVGNQLRLQLANSSTQLVLCDVRVSGECKDRTWGESCENTCGACANLTQCDKSNGHCLNGCDDGYKNTSDCKTVVDKTDTDFMLHVSAGAIAGAAVGLVVLVASSILITACICRKKYLPALQSGQKSSYANAPVSLICVQSPAEPDTSIKSHYENIQNSTEPGTKITPRYETIQRSTGSEHAYMEMNKN